MQLYRVFTHRHHAEEFLSGAIRFRPLDAYRAMEHAARGDPGEGMARHREHRADRTAVVIQNGVGREVASPGEVTVHTEVGNPVFLCCFTAPPDAAAWERIRKEFGDIVVEVADSQQLIADLQAAVNQNDPWQHGALVLWPVAYNKGELLGTTREQRDPIRHAATQKAPEHAYQHEHRIVLISYAMPQVDGEPPDPLYIQLPKALEYAKLL